MKAPPLPAPTDYDPGDPTGTKFVLHDGPPYANGRLHMGHALNKLLKDMVLRDRRRRGYHAPFLPNWDCHGLPLESKFQHRRDEFPTRAGYLAALRAEASHWAQVQHEGFQTLGVAYDSENRTLSSDPASEALVMSEFHRMVRAGLVYRRERPVSWSPMDGTVLADAESVDVEMVVPTVVAAFPLTQPLHDGDAVLAVWTTTPWSLPGNVGLAWNRDAAYGLYAHRNSRVVCVDATADEMLPGAARLRDVAVDELVGAVPRHPLHAHGYPLTGRDHPLVAAAFVAADKGTGFVHLGPSHSLDDWQVWEHDYPNVVGEDGRYRKDLPLFGGLHVVDGASMGEADVGVLEALREAGAVLHDDRRSMTLKRSWRSEGLLVTRATDQWFVDLSQARERALEAVESGDVRMVPESSRNRFLSMLRTRPDWLVSRQREWGVPLGLYVHRDTGEVLADPAVMDAVVADVRRDGVAAWLDSDPASHFAAAGRVDQDDWVRTTDVLDVWFDSACVADYGQGPADLVVEGTDQHRGWFSSTLLKACALGDPLPFTTVLTHGFVLDDAREKMAKSRGNGLTPEEAVTTHGSDVLRLWVALVDVTADMPFGHLLLEEARVTRDKMRNTLRYLTGVLRDWTPADARFVPHDPHDLLLLAETRELAEAMDAAGDAFDFRRQLELVRTFLDHRLSGHHLDVRKDRLYCDGGTPEWHACRATLMAVYAELLDLLGPLTPTLVDEMRTALPLPDDALTVRRADLGALDLRVALERADDTVAELQAQTGLKRSDAAVTLGREHHALLDLAAECAAPGQAARWLKVDRVSAGDDDMMNPVNDPVCPRCRRHEPHDEGRWCNRCEEVSGV